MPTIRLSNVKHIMIFSAADGSAVSELLLATSGSKSRLTEMNAKHLLGLGRNEIEVLDQPKVLTTVDSTIVMDESAAALNAFLYGVRDNRNALEELGESISEETRKHLVTLHKRITEPAL